MIFILRFAFLLLFFLFRGPTKPDEANVRSAFVKDNVPSIIHAPWEGKSYHSNWIIFYGTRCRGSLTQTRKQRKRRQAKAEAAGENSAGRTVCGGGESLSLVGAIESSAPFQWRERPELHRFIRTAGYQVQSFGELHKLQPPHVTLMTAEGMESGAPRSSTPHLDREIY